MSTRREQFQAFRFLTRRIVSALLTGEPETNELPMRRFAYAVFASSMVAVMVFAGVGIYGLLFPSGRQPAENTVIVERETGAKYLYLQGLLHPVLNWTSARLILAQSTPTVKAMSQASLRDVPRGRAVGISGVPDDLPPKSALLGLPWTVCSAPESPASVTQDTYVFVGHVPAGGASLDAASGVLVSTGAGTQRYLVWNDHRLRVPDNGTIAALGWAGVQPSPVDDGLLNALPPGPDLAVPTVPGAGTPVSNSLIGVTARVGQLFRAAGQYYIMVAGGLSPVGAVTAQLLTAAGRAATDISAQQAGQALVNTAVEPPGFPAELPKVTGAGGPAMVCAAYLSAGTADRPVTVQTYASPSSEATVTPELAAPAQLGPDGIRTADRVALAGGHAELVSMLAPTGATAIGTVYLLTDEGIKYPLADTNTSQVETSLGYDGVKPLPVPASILALIPTGPALDPQVATQFVGPPAVSVGPTSPAAIAR